MNSRRPRTTWLIRAGVLAAVAVLFWLVPPFHIVRVNATGTNNPRQQGSGAAFDASAYAEKLWNDRLVKSNGSATDAVALLAEIRKDPKAARKKHGRGSEMASTYYYFVAGEGRVTAVKPGSVSLSISAGGPGTEPDIVLETGNIFGNAVRDATGFVDVSSFANSRDFNAISSEINRRVEERVLPALREKAKAGSTVRFAGCAEIVSEDTDLRPLRIVPISAVVQ